MASVTYETGDGERVALGVFDENAELFYDRSGNTLIFAVPSGATHSWDVDSTAEMTLSAAALTLAGVTLDLNSQGSINNVGTAGNDWTTNALSLVSSNSAATNLLTVSNTEATNGASDAQVNITSGGASGGDPAIKFLVTGAGVITMGLDNSDTDALVWSNNAALGTTNRMVLVKATGILTGDGAAGGADEPVGVFDEYDDAMELQRFAYSHPTAVPAGVVTLEQSDANRERWVELSLGQWMKEEEGEPEHFGYSSKRVLR